MWHHTEGVMGGLFTRWDHYFLCFGFHLDEIFVKNKENYDLHLVFMTADFTYRRVSDSHRTQQGKHHAVMWTRSYFP